MAASASPRSFVHPNSIPHEVLIQDKRGYQLLAESLREMTGINMPFTDKNASLMASRLHSVLKDFALPNYRALHKEVVSGNEKARIAFVESLTTNKTEFFRENQHFAILAEQLPEILNENRSEGRRELRIWCGAASTGQEPYSLAMCLRENIPDLGMWNVKFLATDIDTQVLKHCVRATYTKREVADIDKTLLDRYFTAGKRKDDVVYTAKPALRDMIRFAELNLMENPFPFQHKFDVIFCRNVLIYFDRETQGAVIERMANALRPGGYLFIGHTETGAPKPANLSSVAVAVYRRNE